MSEVSPAMSNDDDSLVRAAQSLEAAAKRGQMMRSKRPGFIRRNIWFILAVAAGVVIIWNLINALER